MGQRETENNAYAKFWGDKQRALWYVVVFSGVVNSVLEHGCVFYKLIIFRGISLYSDSDE